LRSARTEDELTRLLTNDNLDSNGSEAHIQNLKKMGEYAFSSPAREMCSGDQETRKPGVNDKRLRSAARYPTKSIFNLTDSKANLVNNASMPR